MDFSMGSVIKVHSSQLKGFKDIALSNDLKRRYRLCLHDNPNNILQEMIICRTRGDYMRPHKHHNMPETHTIIEGRELVVLFSDDGEIIDHFVLDRENGYVSYRINGEIFHMTLSLSETALDYETKPGPFDPYNNIFAQWSPDESDTKEARAFCNRILQKLGFI